MKKIIFLSILSIISHSLECVAMEPEENKRSEGYDEESYVYNPIVTSERRYNDEHDEVSEKGKLTAKPKSTGVNFTQSFANAWNSELEVEEKNIEKNPSDLKENFPKLTGKIPQQLEKK